MAFNRYIHAACCLLALLAGSHVFAQTISVTEDFNSATTINPWFATNGACLTANASTSASGSATATSAGVPPGCLAIRSSYYNENLVGGFGGVAGSAQTLPDSIGNGALRFTNGCIYNGGCGNGGHYQSGSIISGNSYSSSAGIQITFKTTTYRGDSGSIGGGISGGADGMSFFLMDGSVSPNIGSTGGSLGYSCSNGNADYHGITGGYIGLGIDEFGNFLNAGDNTASGYGPGANRIGLRGAGSIAYAALNKLNPTYYPSYLSSALQQQAVQNTCRTGLLWNYVTGLLGVPTLTPVLDYPAIPNAYKVLSGVKIANEYSTGGYARSSAVPILYKLRITPDGLLSFSYSVNGGSWLGVLTNQSIMASNGALPPTIRFGFAGSTGGSSNIHEVLCFKAASLVSAQGSAGSNLQQSSKVISTSQAYFAFYNPNDWSGRLTANPLVADAAGNLTIATQAAWDASCVLTGVPTGQSCSATGAGPTAAQGATNRAILTWNGSTGVPFEWSNPGLSTVQKATLNLGDTTSTANRLNYLRGDQSNEFTTAGTGLYRVRTNILGDIVDSSPIPVGQPNSAYLGTWKDRLISSDVMSENSGSQNYLQYFTAQQTRQNVVYVGANDGLVHGFRAGSYNTSNAFQSGSNDGREVLAYMPGAVVNTIHNSLDTTLDFSSAQYGHNFYVDATPAGGDLFYKGAWHTWLVGGIGPGGAAFYALDITSPSSFSETNASSIVIGEWTPANLLCSNSLVCALSLGNTYGTPVIRRMHNGMWAVIFGNGYGSTSGDAGIFIMTVDPGTAARTFYYLSAGKTGTGDGIAYVNPVDLDGDHITDYIYAGDLLGNVWRFDVSTATPATWGVSSSAPLFAAGPTHPITTAMVVAAVTTPLGPRVTVAFGTGQQIPVTNASATSFSTVSQSIYAVWDWNFKNWNAKSSVDFLSLDSSASNFSTSTGLTAPYTIAASNLTTQTLTVNAASSTVDISSMPVCWAGGTACSVNKSFGWTAVLPGGQEQIIYNPQLVGTAFVVNSIIPAINSPLSCTSGLSTGYTYAIALDTGSVATTSTVDPATNNTTSTNFFPSSNDPVAGGVQTNATGTSFIATATVTTGATTTGGNTGGASGGGPTSGLTCTGANCASPVYASPFAGVAGCALGNTFLVYQTTAGTGATTRIAPNCPLTGNRVTWSQKR
jgi:type IV pilus assembly protein PilY1